MLSTQLKDTRSNQIGVVLIEILRNLPRVYRWVLFNPCPWKSKFESSGFIIIQKKDHVLAYWCAHFQQCHHWSCGLLHLKLAVWKRNGLEHWSRNVGKPSPHLSPANPCQLSAQLHLSTERCRQSNLLHISSSASEGAKNKPPLQTQKAHHLSWHSEVRPSWNPLLDPQKNVFRSPMSDMRSLFPSSLSSLLPCDLFSKPPFISPSLEDHASPKEKRSSVMPARSKKSHQTRQAWNMLIQAAKRFAHQVGNQLVHCFQPGISQNPNQIYKQKHLRNKTSSCQAKPWGAWPATHLTNTETHSLPRDAKLLKSCSGPLNQPPRPYFRSLS